MKSKSAKTARASSPETKTNLMLWRQRALETANIMRMGDTDEAVVRRAKIYYDFMVNGIVPEGVNEKA